MRISYRYLKEMVDFSLSPGELARRLTNFGLEVRGVEPFGRLEDVVVGKVLSIQDHPNADRLKVVKTDIGEKTLSLVCGAPNIREGLLVPVALEGARLHSGKRVERLKIRGVDSPGMICSEAELGLGDDESGIMILPSSLPLGELLSQTLDLEDFILDLEITSNRGDCLSMVGIAREVSALTGGSLHLPFSRIRERKASKAGAPQVEIEEPNLCPYYSARLIRNVKLGPSPLWLWRRILVSGGRPVNNVVDVTNYVLWEMGQPLHPFDYSRLTEGRIVVRRARKGESLTTLDGIGHKLDDDMLIIADAVRPVALAGVMGGEDTQVQAHTQDVLLESAYFDPISIRRTSRKINLFTEASYRFERGVDPSGMRRALDRASYLIQEVAGGKIEEPVEEENLPRRRKWVFLRPSRVNRILGGRIASSKMRNILENLQFKVKEDKRGWRVDIPSFRRDIEQEIDLVEEIARFYGYDRLGTSLPSPGAQESEENIEELVRERIKEILRGLGFYEVVGMEILDRGTFIKARLSPEEGIIIGNPLSLQHEILATHLFPHLLGVASYNLNQGMERFRIFELADIFECEHSPEERPSLSGLVLEEGFDFFSLKGIIEASLEGLSIKETEFSPCNCEYLSGVQRAIVRGRGVDLGVLGRLDSKICQNFKLPSSLYLFEFDFSALLSLYIPGKKFKPLPRFPSIRRDLSLIVGEEIPANTVKEIILEGGKMLEKAELFDIYRGKPIPEGHKSLAYSLIFRAPDRTLKDEEIDGIQQSIVRLLRKRLGARLRVKSDE